MTLEPIALKRRRHESVGGGYGIAALLCGTITFNGTSSVSLGLLSLALSFAPK